MPRNLRNMLREGLRNSRGGIGREISGGPRFAPGLEQRLEEHSTVEITTTGSTMPQRTYRFATAEMIVFGFKYDRGLKEIGSINQSITRSVNGTEVILQNVDFAFRGLASSVGQINPIEFSPFAIAAADFINNPNEIQGATVKIGRYWRDVDTGQEWHEIVMQGVVQSPQGNQDALRLQVISDIYARSIGGGRRVARKCQWKFRQTNTCAYSGVEVVCNKLLNSAGGCSGRSNQHRYGGFVYIQPSSSVSGAASTSPPPANQLIKTDNGSLTTFKQQPFMILENAVVSNDNTAQATRVAMDGGLGWKNVISFGADPTGVADSTTAFNNALATLGYVYAPPGTYTFSGTITLPESADPAGLTLRGASVSKTILQFTGATNGIVATNARHDHVVFQDFSIVSTNGSSLDGFEFVGSSDVQGRMKFERVAIKNWGGYGIFSLNMQSSTIANCHIRGCKKGAIALEDDNLGEFTREPNANQIINCLLDNSPQNGANVAMIRLFNANGTLIEGTTIQGHWTGGTGSKPAILVEQCNGVVLNSNWIEGLTNTAAAVKIKNSRGITVTGLHGSGLHATDFDLENARGVHIVGSDLRAVKPHVVADANCRGITVTSGIYSEPNNLTNSDSSADGIKIDQVTYQSYTSSLQSVDLCDWEQSHDPSQQNCIVNGSFTSDLSGWSGPATGISRVATGGVPSNGPYMLCNTQGLSSGGAIGFNFQQTYNVPDSVPAGPYTLAFKFYVESFGASANALRWVDIEYAVSGGSGQGYRIQSNNFVLTASKWYWMKMKDYLGTGTSRTIVVNINPTQGPDTPRVRFADFQLVQGTELIREPIVATVGGGSGDADYYEKSSAAANNSGTTETDLHSWTLPANFFSADGVMLSARFSGSFAANANQKELKLYVAGTAIHSSGFFTFFNGQKWNYEVEVIRVDSDSVRVAGWFTGGDVSAFDGSPDEIFGAGFMTIFNTDVNSLSFAGSLIVKVTGRSGSGSNDVTQNYSTVKKWTP